MAQLVVGLDIGTSAVRAAELDVSSSRPVLLTYGQVGLPPARWSKVRSATARRSPRRSSGCGPTGTSRARRSSSASPGSGPSPGRSTCRSSPTTRSTARSASSRRRSSPSRPTDHPVVADPDRLHVAGRRQDAAGAGSSGPSDLVNGVIEAVDKAGLTVVRRRPHLVRLVRAIGGPDETDQPEAIVSVGAGLTVVVVHQQGRPQFVRTIGSGGNATTAAISGGPGRSRLDAEGMKRRIGEENTQSIGGAGRGVHHGRPGRRDPELIQYFASLPGAPVSRVLVTGGGSALMASFPCSRPRSPPVLTVSPLARLEHLEAGPDRSPGRRGPAGARHAHRPGIARARQGGEEVQPAPARGGQRPAQADPGADAGRLCRGVLVLLLALGMWKLLQVHNAQNNVNALQSNINTLNAETPKYDAVVAANRPTPPGSPAGPRFSTPRSTGLAQQPDLDHAGRCPGQVFNGPATALRSSGTGTAPRRAPPPPPRAAPARVLRAHDVGGHRHRPAGRDRTRAEPVHLEGLDQRRRRSQLFANPLQGATTVNPDSTISFPSPSPSHPTPACQECEPQMNAAREYRVPLLIGAGTLVVVLLLWVALISPENTKLSSLQAQQTQLQTQETALQAKLAALWSEQQKLSTSAPTSRRSPPSPQCPEPDRHRCRGVLVREPVQRAPSEFRSHPAQFSGFAPATSTAGTSARPPPPSASAGRPGTRQPGVIRCRPRWRSPVTTARCWPSSTASTASPACS